MLGAVRLPERVRNDPADRLAGGGPAGNEKVWCQ